MNAVFSKIPRPVLFGLSVFAVLHLLIVLVDHFFYRTVALDYAIYNFAFYDFAHLRLSPVPAYIFPFPANFLQDHFSLTLVFLAPLYWLFSPIFGTYSLLIIQWGFIMAGAVYTYRLILLKSGSWFFSFLALIYYFTLFGRYSAYRADVNLAILGSALVPVLLFFFEARNKAGFLTVFIFLLFNREDYSLWFLFIAAWLFVLHFSDREKRKWSIYLFFGSLIYLLLVFFVFIPGMEDDQKKYALFDFTAVGQTPAEALVFVFKHPLKAIELLFVNHNPESYYKWVKLDFYMVYLISGGLVLFFRPAFLIPLLPLLAKKMYDDNPLRWSTETYYSVEFVSILPVLVFMVLGRNGNNRTRLIPAFAVLLTTALVTIFKLFVPPPNPIVGESNKYNFLSAKFYQPEHRLRQVRAFMSRIPDGAAVCGSGHLIPHLSFREKVYYFPNIGDAEFVILFKSDDSYPLTPEEYALKTEHLKKNGSWSWEENEELLFFTRKSNGG